MFGRLIFLLILLSSFTTAWSQTPQFRVIPVDVEVSDKFDRPYTVEANTAWVGARLAQNEKQSNKAVAGFETLSSAGVEYPRQTQDYVKFPVQNGVAKVQFVLFQDDPTPVDYELALIQGNEIHPLSPEKWAIGLETSHGAVKAEGLRAPHSRAQIAGIAAFGVIGVILGYWLLGRQLFARMLRQRNMDVGAALGWSNLLVLLAVALTVAGVCVMLFFPWILWQKLYWIYVLVPAVYAVALGLIYGTGHLMTRA